MAKVLLIVIVVVIAAWWLIGRQGRVTRKDKADGGTASDGSEQIVPCAHCGVHLPRGDALMDGDLAYCSTAHRAAGPRAR